MYSKGRGDPYGKRDDNTAYQLRILRAKCQRYLLPVLYFDGLESFLCANESIKIKANAQISTAEKNGEWEDISNTMQTQTEKM